MDNKEINDKAHLDNNEGLAEKIIAQDTDALFSSDIVTIEPQPYAIGTMVEIGQLKGMKDVAQIALKIINDKGDEKEKSRKLQDFFKKILNKKIYPYYEDIRRFEGVVEAGDRRSLGVNQYLYGVVLDLSQKKGFYDWDEVFNTIKNLNYA